MWISIAVVFFACSVLASDALRFQPIDWNSWQMTNEKREASAADLDPETLKLLIGLYQRLQNEYESQHESELRRKLWPTSQTSHTNPDTLAIPPEMTLNAGQVDKKNSDRNTRNYKNCFLSPVQCVMKGRA